LHEIPKVVTSPDPVIPAPPAESEVPHGIRLLEKAIARALEVRQRLEEAMQRRGC
jgi:hypothetical protein